VVASAAPSTSMLGGSGGRVWDIAGKVMQHVLPSLHTSMR
jgi:hypothetical protein